VAPASHTRNREEEVSAIKPSENEPLSALAEAVQSLFEGVKRAGVKRPLVVGGAGTMEVAPGVQALDVFTIPEEWKPEVMAHREAWEVYRKNGDRDWTYFSPPVFLEPGERTGTYRLGIDGLWGTVERKRTLRGIPSSKASVCLKKRCTTGEVSKPDGTHKSIPDLTRRV